MSNYVFDVISKAYERGYTVNIGSVDEEPSYCTCRVVVSDGHYKHAKYIPGCLNYPMMLSEEYLPKLIDEMIDYIQGLYKED